MLLSMKEILREFMKMSKKWKSLVCCMVVLIVGLSCLMVLGGCRGVSESYVKANYKFMKLAIPDFIVYIKADKKLTDISKKARVKAAEDVLRLNKKAYNDIEGKTKK